MDAVWNAYGIGMGVFRLCGRRRVPRPSGSRPRSNPGGAVRREIGPERGWRRCKGSGRRGFAIARAERLHRWPRPQCVGVVHAVVVPARQAIRVGANRVEAPELLGPVGTGAAVLLIDPGQEAPLVAAAVSLLLSFGCKIRKLKASPFILDQPAISGVVGGDDLLIRVVLPPLVGPGKVLRPGDDVLVGAERAPIALQILDPGFKLRRAEFARLGIAVGRPLQRVDRVIRTVGEGDGSWGNPPGRSRDCGYSCRRPRPIR